MNILLKKSLLAAFCCIVLVVFSYLYVDKTVAFWVYHHHLSHYRIFQWFTRIPELIVIFIIPFYVIYVICFLSNLKKFQSEILLAMANSVVIADFIKDQLKFVFGRYWPQTWIYNNPSLINNNAYGFNFFHSGSWYGSFPSGHTTLTIAVMTIVWLAYPKYRWVAIGVSLLVVIGLLSMDYHFVSDIIAGTFLGAMTAFFVVKMSGHNSQN